MILTYNGVNLGGYLLTQSIEQGPVMDPSGTDQLYNRIRISCQSLVTYPLNPAIGGESPTQTMLRIRHLLTSPRRSLVYSDGTTNYVNLPGGLDDANGPIPDPTALQVVQITPGAWLVTFAVTVHLVDCTSTPPAYLSNRWEDAETVDRDWYKVRRRTGTLIVSSRGAVSPDDFRSLISPTVPVGFRRETADYKRSADGLKIHYNFVDKQLSKLPPLPGTKLTGRQVASITNFGGKRMGEIALTLTAPPTVDPKDMLRALVVVAMARIRVSSPFTQKNGSPQIKEGSISENLDDEKNEVSLRLRWQMQGDAGRLNDLKSSGTGAGGLFGGGIAGFILATSPPPPSPPTPEGKDKDALSGYAGWLGLPLVGDYLPALAPPTRGLASDIPLYAAALRDPCGLEISLSTGAEPNTLVGTVNGSTLTATQLTSDIPDDEQALYTDDGPGVWDHYEVTCHYVDDVGGRVLPPAEIDGPQKVVLLHGRALNMRCEWSLKRTGGAPTAPKIVQVTDPNWYYTGGVTSPKNLDVAGDGVSIVYECSGVWNFACLDWKKADITYPIPSFLSASILKKPSTLAPAGSAVGTGGGTDAGAGTGDVGGAEAGLTVQPPYDPFGLLNTSFGFVQAVGPAVNP